VLVWANQLLHQQPVLDTPRESENAIIWRRNKMQILCREQHDDEVEQEVTQRDQFNTDEVTLVSTLVREPHQNSLDAIARPDQPVRTRLRIVQPEPTNRAYFENLFSGLVPHLQSSGIDLTDIDLGMPRILLVEDFGTTGLTGDFTDRRDKSPFNNFWRRIGRSTKGGTAGGRWGLGKLVFSSASQIQTFFGLTIRRDDPERIALLMGQAVLANREVDGKAYAPHVFFAMPGATGLQLPDSDPANVEAFRRSFGITRGTEPGLSIAVPFVLPLITESALIPEVLQNYFFPILTGRLTVEVGQEVISEAAFDAVSAKYGWGSPESNSILVSFVRELHQAKQPDAVLGTSWTDSMEQALEPAVLEQLRARLGTDGGLIHVRAPVTLRRKNGEACETYFDLFLRKTPDGSRGRALYVRSAITVPDEARFFTPRQTLGALIATHEGITSFLGDAENPAHTKWNGQADKLKNWKNAPGRLREIRNSLNRLQNALMQAVETVEPDALKDLFSIRDDSGAKQPRGGAQRPLPPPPPGPIPLGPKPWYRIDRAAGGFRIHPGEGLAEENLPFELKVKAAYDVARGDAFAKFRPYDFDLNRKQIGIAVSGVDYAVTSANELTFTVQSINFSVELHGFDGKRDLVVKATR